MNHQRAESRELRRPPTSQSTHLQVVVSTMLFVTKKKSGQSGETARSQQADKKTNVVPDGSGGLALHERLEIERSDRTKPSTVLGDVDHSLFVDRPHLL